MGFPREKQKGKRPSRGKKEKGKKGKK